jgi:enoyl-[acyl-carrier-protein] reductase (NADH)
MNNERAIELLHRLQDEQFDGIHGDERREALEMAVRALSGDGDTISRKMAIDAMWKIRRQQQMLDDTHKADLVMHGIYLAEKALEKLPSAQPEYEPVTAEDFAKTMSENTLYSFMAWHHEAITLMNEMGFVICKKTM